MPSNRFQKATILSHARAGRGYYRLVLRASETASAAVPGSFVMLRVSANLDPLLARPFGIASLPTRSSIEIYYRVAGRGTGLLTTMEAGQSLNLLGPLGNGFQLPDRAVMPVLVSGGSGFPPLHFFSLKAGSRAHVFIGARDKDCLPPAPVVTSFREHVAGVHITTEDGSAGRQGMTTDALAAFLDKREAGSLIVLYACGPRGMLAAVSRMASEHGILCFVSMEERMACGVGTCMGCSVSAKDGGYRRICREGPVFDSREIEWGEQFPVKMKR
ncbi:MAG TPA: dihydroorotate dehydrogenase electron transfer subunit [Nitrospirota bacterium]|nr:dihydroorotate dehydrogenase electron transfer subunit [Nitrospirota bacterium]